MEILRIYEVSIYIVCVCINIHAYNQCYFSFEKGSGKQTVTQNSVGEGWC
jgi:hypothetical protein